MKNANFKRIVDELVTLEGKELRNKTDFIEDLLETEDITHIRLALKRRSTTTLLENDSKNYDIIVNFVKAIQGVEAIIELEKEQKNITKKQVHKKETNFIKIHRMEEAKIQLIKELVNWLYVEE